MKNMLAFLAAVLIGFLGVGWYLGWYTFKPVSSSGGSHSFNVNIDSAKIKSDIAKGVQKGEEKLHDVLDRDKKADDGAAVKTGDSDKASPVLKIPGRIFGGEGEAKPARDPRMPE